MIEKFNGIIYLIVFIVHFLGFGVYAYQMIINNKKFRAKFEMDETATPITVSYTHLTLPTTPYV